MRVDAGYKAGWGVALWKASALRCSGTAADAAGIPVGKAPGGWLPASAGIRQFVLQRTMLGHMVGVAQQSVTIAATAGPA